MDEYLISQIIATTLLIVFSLGLGHQLRHLGFGTYGLLDRRVSYEERVRMEVGKRARRPLLIRHAESWWCSIGLTSLPAVLNSGLLALLYQSGSYVLLPVIVVPVMLAEFALAWWIQKQWVPMYQADYARYMLLTDANNDCFNGRIIYQGEDSPCIVNGGRIIRIARVLPGGRVKNLNLFVSFRTCLTFGIRKLEPLDPVRIFFRPYGKPRRETSIAIDGELVGIQLRKSHVQSLNHGDLEAHGLTI